MLRHSYFEMAADRAQPVHTHLETLSCQRRLHSRLHAILDVGTEGEDTDTVQPYVEGGAGGAKGSKTSGSCSSGSSGSGNVACTLT